MHDTVIDKSSPFYGFVDHVVVMGCTKYRLRQKFIRHELGMLGITSYTSLVQPDSSIAEHVLRGVPHFRGLDTHNVSNTWFNHYYATRLCHDMGYDRVLLLEDDAAFLTDHSAIRNALSEVKDKYALLLLDPVIMSPGEHAEAVKRGVAAGMPHWGVVTPGAGPAGCPRCAGCRILSKEAVSAYVDLHECLFTGGCPDGVLYPADMWHRSVMLRTGKPVLYAVPPLSTQSRSAERGPYTGYAHANYVSYGVDVSRYGHADAVATQQDAGEGDGDASASAVDADMWSRFDFRAVNHYSGHLSRKALLDSEFRRVGLDRVVEFWGAPDPFIQALCRSLKLDGRCTQDMHLVAVTLRHQQMIRTAYDTGARFGLFMESDIVFLHDTDLLRESVRHAPADADVLLFEWIAPWGPKEFHDRIKARESGDYWYRFGRTGVLNCGCYALNRKAMAVMLRILEEPADGQTLFAACDRHWPVLSDESGLNVYVSSPVACIQNEAKHSHAYEAVGAGRELYGA